MKVACFCIFALLVFIGGATGAENDLRAGAAKVNMTIAPGRSQTGKYDHETLYVRAIALDNGNASGSH
jgi:hypothetical protein